jgi:hypothetical protein
MKADGNVLHAVNNPGLFIIVSNQYRAFLNIAALVLPGLYKGD